RILFPAAGVMVVSAWCLGILNSHRKFLLSYSAPVVWNAAIILAVFWGGDSRDRIVTWACWGALAGAVLQVLVQLPAVLRVTGGVSFRSWRGSSETRLVVRTFFPALISRGAAQVSAFIDLALAGFLPGGAVAAIAN